MYLIMYFDFLFANMFIRRMLGTISKDAKFKDRFLVSVAT
jgi:hypothetical protein